MDSTLYIRFGEIPTDEISGIYNYDEGRVGNEVGVSCFDCIEREGIYKIVIPQIETCGMNYTIEGLMEDFELGKKKGYLITGKDVGVGSHGEPCLKQVEIAYELVLKNKQLIIKQRS